MIRVQEEDFDVSDELKKLREQACTGAVAMFVGLVRDMNEGDEVSSLFLEHYPGMTEKSLQLIVEKAQKRWTLIDVTIIHRVGLLQVQDQIVFVGVASEHRENAFLACQFIMDYLKTAAPFWKKETVGEKTRWVDAKQSDEAARERWLTQDR